MVTIKAYTDLEQSKKLAEILPIESTDTYYTTFYGKFSKDFPIPKELYDTIKYPINMDKVVPAWSLASLLSILPKVINNETLFIETSPALWHIGYRNIYTARADNPIDACYEIILKLNEMKML